MSAEQQVRRAMERAAKQGKLNCRQLLDLAERTGTPPRQIGRLCDEMNIRISNCQLGCFR